MSTTTTPPVSVSLIVPSFNRGDLIKETIDCALAQSWPFAEIIVVDDGSTDATVEVLAQYGDKIKLIRQERRGVQAARNAGVALARGDYITLCDSDDLLEPEFVETASRWMGAHPEFDAFYCNFSTFNDTGLHPDKFSQAPAGFFDGAKESDGILYDIPDLYVRTVGYQPLFITGCLVKRSFWDGMGGFNTAFNNVGGEDWEFTLRAISTGKVAVARKRLARVRKHNSNQSGDPIRQVRGTARILEHGLTAHPGAERYREAIVRSIELRRTQVFDMAFSRGNFEIASEMLGLLRAWPKQPKFLIKVFVTKLPNALRQPFWRMTQQ